MRALIALAWLLSAAAPGRAHDGVAHSVAASWTFDPWVVTPLCLAGLLYMRGLLRLARRRGGLGRRRAGPALLYALGWLTLAGSLLSPLHWLGERIFTFHMIEHEIIMAVSAPLLVLARPLGLLLWGLPVSVRLAAARTVMAGPARGIWRRLAVPHHATIIHGVALWAWHAPPLLEATLGNVVLHRLQHLSFFASAMLFWWALRRVEAGVAAIHVFITMLHMSALGALIALSPRLIYPVQTAEAERWGLTPLEDQQLAGLLMWVPAGTVYAGAALVMAAAWIGGSARATPAGRLRPGLAERSG